MFAAQAFTGVCRFNSELQRGPMATGAPSTWVPRYSGPRLPSWRVECVPPLGRDPRQRYLPRPPTSVKPADSAPRACTSACAQATARSVRRPRHPAPAGNSSACRSSRTRGVRPGHPAGLRAAGSPPTARARTGPAEARRVRQGADGAGEGQHALGPCRGIVELAGLGGDVRQVVQRRSVSSPRCCKSQALAVAGRGQHGHAILGTTTQCMDFGSPQMRR